MNSKELIVEWKDVYYRLFELDYACGKIQRAFEELFGTDSDAFKSIYIHREHVSKALDSVRDFAFNGHRTVASIELEHRNLFVLIMDMRVAAVNMEIAFKRGTTWRYDSVTRYVERVGSLSHDVSGMKYERD